MGKIDEIKKTIEHTWELIYIWDILDYVSAESYEYILEKWEKNLNHLKNKVKIALIIFTTLFCNYGKIYRTPWYAQE